MKIVRVIARGFKTYRDTTVIGEFDERLNCIVGLNGSGKSSLFQAIIFVLSPELNSPSFLHEGSTGKSQSGFVEIEFSNSASIQSLRRTISVDDSTGGFMVNGKHVAAKSDYITILQSVGLGGTGKKSSSYFVVEQGRVVSVATISDKQRFELIKEACGIDVFTVKKTESLKILSETESKREKIKQVMSNIDSRCDQLEKESKELTEYSRLEKERDYVEYQIGKLEIEELENSKKTVDFEIKELKKNVEKNEIEIATLLNRKMVLEKNEEESIELKEIKIRLSQLFESKNEIMGKISDMSNQLSLEKENREKSVSVISSLGTQLVSVTEREIDVMKTIESEKEEMKRLQTDVGSIRQEKLTLMSELESIERMGSSVEDLENRKKQLLLISSSLDLRGRNLESLKKVKEEEFSRLVMNEIPFIESRFEKATEEINLIQSNREMKISKIRSIEEEKISLENKLFSLKSQKSYSHQKQIDNLTKELGSLSSGVFRGDKKLLSVDSKDSWTLNGIRGLFGDFIKIPSYYRRAVELCSKNVLFNLVIDSDEIADKFVLKFGGSKFGRLTLFPLNRVGNCDRESELVARIESDVEFRDKVKVLSSVISGEEEWVKNLILKFFSKIVIVENVDVGFAVSKKYGVETITPEGDIISKHLILRSGSSWSSTTTTSSSIVSSWQQIIGIRKKIVAEKTELSKINFEIKELESKICGLKEEAETLSAEIINVSSELIAEQNSMRKKLDELVRMKMDLESFEIPTILGEIEELILEKKRIANEIGVVENQLVNPGNLSVMSKSDREVKVGGLTKKISELTAEIESREQVIVRLSKTISVNQSELVHFIGNKKQSLEELIRERNASVLLVDRIIEKLEHAMGNLKISELNVVEGEIQTLTEQEKVENEKVSQSRSELESLKNELSDLENQVRLMTEKLCENERKKDRIDFEISNVKTNSIRQLSSIPTDGFVSSNLSELKSRMLSLVKLLNLSKFEVLNKNAIEQYEKIASERSQLSCRQTEIEESDRAIRLLLDELNTKEEKMIDNAFCKIKSSFESLFRRVTNGVGKAEIEMEKEENNKCEIDGKIRIRVGFPSDNMSLEWKSMAELSGGQRTVVALCFLISLHRANESATKFFILDEVDAALDSVYRFGIADAVRQESRENNTQFLFTSFRAELASVADRHFLVSMSRGTSRVDSVDLPTALSLVNLNEDSKDNTVNRRSTMVPARE